MNEQEERACALGNETLQVGMERACALGDDVLYVAEHNGHMHLLCAKVVKVLARRSGTVNLHVFGDGTSAFPDDFKVPSVEHRACRPEGGTEANTWRYHGGVGGAAAPHQVGGAAAPHQSGTGVSETPPAPSAPARSSAPGRGAH